MSASRRNSTRRVSFAATAHVRLFEKEESNDNHEEQELQKTLQMFHPENKKYRLLTSLFDVSCDSAESYEVSLTGSPNMFREKLGIGNAKLNANLATGVNKENITDQQHNVTPRSKLAVFSSATPILDSYIQKRNTPTPVKNLVKELEKSPSILVQIAEPQTFQTPADITDIIGTVTPKVANTSVANDSIMMSPITKERDSSMFIEMESPSYPKFQRGSTRNSLSGIAPYLKSTPRSATALRHSFFPDENTPDTASPVTKNQNQSPSIQNSISDFFEMEPSKVLKPVESKPIPSKARNSITPFFTALEGCETDTDSTIGARAAAETGSGEDDDDEEVFSEQSIKPDDFKKGRPSVAPFFKGLDGCDSADESFQLDCSVDKSTPKAAKTGSKRGSVAPFFHGLQDNLSDSSFAESVNFGEETAEIVNVISKSQPANDTQQTFDERRKKRTSIAHFFQEESEGESMLLDESRDMTDHAATQESDNHNYFSTQESVSPRSTQESADAKLGRSSSTESQESHGSNSLGRSNSGESMETNTSEDSSELDISKLIELDSLANTPVKADLTSCPKIASPAIPASALKAEEGDDSNTPRRRSTRTANSPKSATRKATPKKLSKVLDLKKSAVTPMRRALAQKVLAGSTVEKADTGVTSPIAPKASTSKPVTPRVGSSSPSRMEIELKKSTTSPRRSKRSTISFLESPIKKSKVGNALIEKQADSPVVEKGTEEDTPLDVDLMDETFMSIMDTSIVHEKSQDDNNTTQEFEELLMPKVIEIKDLKAFLDASGIAFKPPSEFIENPRQLPADNTNIYDNMVQQIDNIYGEYYHHGCTELSTILKDLQSAIDGFHDDIAESRPLFFDDYAQGTSLERDTISSNLKISKEYCYYEVKSDWLNWKKMLLEKLMANLMAYEVRLRDYNNQIEPIISQFRRVVKDSQEYLDDLVRNILLVKQENRSKAEQIEEEKSDLDQACREQQIRIQELETQLRLMDVEESNTMEKIRILDMESVKYQCRIEQAEKLCKELVIFEPSDLPVLRDQFALATITHRWKPVYLSKETQVWSFDDAVQLCVSMKNDRYYCKAEVYTPLEAKKTSSLIKSVQSKDTIRNLDAITFDRLVSFLKQFEKGNSISSTKQELSIVFQKFAYQWEALKSLQRDLQHSGEFTSSMVEWVQPNKEKSNPFSYSIRTKFFSPAKATLLQCQLSFSSQGGMLLYPFGSVQIELIRDFGEIEFA